MAVLLTIALNHPQVGVQVVTLQEADWRRRLEEAWQLVFQVRMSTPSSWTWAC